MQNADADSWRQRRLSSEGNVEGDRRARTERRTYRALESVRRDRRDCEARARISALAHAEELAGEFQLQAIGESGESLDARGDCVAEDRFVTDDDDRRPASADCCVDKFAREHRDRFLGQNDRDRIELRALRLVHCHPVAQLDEFTQRFESECDEVGAAREYRHPDLRAVAAPDPQEDSIVAVEESAFVVVAEYDQRLADHEWNPLRSDISGFGGARMNACVNSFGAGLET